MKNNLKSVSSSNGPYDSSKVEKFVRNETLLSQYKDESNENNWDYTLNLNKLKETYKESLVEERKSIVESPNEIQNSKPFDSRDYSINDFEYNNNTPLGY